MAIADEQQRSSRGHRQIDCRAFADLIVVEVAAVRPEIAGAKGLVPGRRDRDAAEHRLELDGVILEMLAGVLQASNALLVVEHPFTVELVLILGALDITWRQGRARNLIAGLSPIAVEADAIQLHNEGIARQRAFDVERTGFRVAALASANVFAVDTAGIDGPGANGIA